MTLFQIKWDTYIKRMENQGIKENLKVTLKNDTFSNQMIN